MTEAEKWSGYNLAEHALGILISHFSACIYTGKKAENPNHGQIENWRKKRTELMKLRRTLTVDDMAMIGRVNEEYGPKAKAIVGNE